jgi:SAM-dependent methyltransferase
MERLTLGGIQDGTVVDLGCGSGITARLLCDAGFDVVGIDASEAMIEIARARAPELDFRVGSWTAAEIPPCVAVAAIGEVLSYIGSDDASGFPNRGAQDRARSSNARAELLGRIHAALAPGGLLLLDMAGPDRAPSSGPRRTFTEGPDWAVLAESEADDARSLLTRRITTFRRVGESYRRDSEVHRLELVDPADVLKSLRDAGFSAQVLDRYGPQALLPGVAGFLAEKAPTSDSS